MSEIKQQLVDKYNEINKTSLTEDDIEFRVDGEFQYVSELSDRQAGKILDNLNKM